MTVHVIDLTDNRARTHKFVMASAIVRAAARDGRERVVVGSCGGYGTAIALAASYTGLAATVVQPAGWGDGGGQARWFGAEVRFVDGGHEDAVSASKQLADTIGAADGNVDGPFAANGLRALASEIVATVSRLPAPPDAVWVPLSNGTTTLAVSAALAELNWPSTLMAVTSTGNNSVLASWPGREHSDLAPEAVVTTAVNEPLVNWSALHGREALDAVHLRHGCVLGVPDTLLIDARGRSRRAGVSATAAGAAGLDLRVLTLRAAITHALSWGCQTDIREALEASATWEQIAAARALPIAQARAEFHRWIDAQAALWEHRTHHNRHPLRPKPQPASPPLRPQQRRNMTPSRPQHHRTTTIRRGAPITTSDSPTQQRPTDETTRQQHRLSRPPCPLNPQTHDREGMPQGPGHADVRQEVAFFVTGTKAAKDVHGEIVVVG